MEYVHVWSGWDWHFFLLGYIPLLCNCYQTPEKEFESSSLIWVKDISISLFLCFHQVLLRSDSMLKQALPLACDRKWTSQVWVNGVFQDNWIPFPPPPPLPPPPHNHLMRVLLSHLFFKKAFPCSHNKTVNPKNKVFCCFFFQLQKTYCGLWLSSSCRLLEFFSMLCYMNEILLLLDAWACVAMLWFWGRRGRRDIWNLQDIQEDHPHWKEQSQASILASFSKWMWYYL